MYGTRLLVCDDTTTHSTEISVCGKLTNIAAGDGSELLTLLTVYLYTTLLSNEVQQTKTCTNLSSQDSSKLLNWLLVALFFGPDRCRIIFSLRFRPCNILHIIAIKNMH